MMDRTRIFNSATEFFNLGCNCAMKLSPFAAIGVCERAAEKGFVIARVEGGLWHSQGFEARLDCIWDGTDPPLDPGEAHQNNLSAANFIRKESVAHHAFVLTVSPVTG